MFRRVAHLATSPTHRSRIIFHSPIFSGQNERAALQKRPKETDKKHFAKVTLPEGSMIETKLQQAEASQKGDERRAKRSFLEVILDGEGLLPSQMVAEPPVIATHPNEVQRNGDDHRANRSLLDVIMYGERLLPSQLASEQPVIATHPNEVQQNTNEMSWTELREGSAAIGGLGGAVFGSLYTLLETGHLGLAFLMGLFCALLGFQFIWGFPLTLLFLLAMWQILSSPPRRK